MSDEVTKNPVGRPRTTVEDLPEDWETIMLDNAQEGASALEIRCKLGIAQTAWETLLADSEEFRLTEQKCMALCQVWWEAHGRKMVKDTLGSAAVWKFNMQNRFGWREKIERDDTVKTTVNVKGLSDAALAELTNARSKADQ